MTPRQVAPAYDEPGRFRTGAFRIPVMRAIPDGTPGPAGAGLQGAYRWDVRLLSVMITTAAAIPSMSTRIMTMPLGVVPVFTVTDPAGFSPG